MDNFIVSARKYRPSTFDMVVGQDSITNTLKNAIKNNHLTQSYLFCGPRGVGKTTCARIFAKTINCTNLKNGVEACEECESCKSFNTLRSFNIHELDAASNNKVDDIRSLTDQVRIPPQVGKYSIYIIDEVHMLSTSAFNAFLKTLEEPPGHAIFILATTEKHKIIPTILSRCQIFDFNRIRIEDIVSRLGYVSGREGITIEDEAVHIIAQKADGAMRDALSIFDQLVSFSGDTITYKDVIENLNVLDYEYYFKAVDSALAGNFTDCLLLFNDVIDNGFDGHNFISGLNSHLRDLLISKDEATVKLLETAPSVRERYRAQALKCSSSFLFHALEAGTNCDLSFKNAKNGRLLVELTLMKLCAIGNSDTFEKKKSNGNLTEEEPENKDAVEKPKQVNPTDTATEKAPEAVILKSENPGSERPANEERKKENSGEQKASVIQSSNGSKSVSLKEMLAGKDESVAEPENLVEETPEQIEKCELTEANLKSALVEFAGLISGASPRMAATLCITNPSLEKSKIHLKLDNDPQKDQFESSFRGKLENFLRWKFDLPDISLHTTVDKEERKDILYTDSQKFEYLADKNPALNALRKSFNLDFD